MLDFLQPIIHKFRSRDEYYGMECSVLSALLYYYIDDTHWIVSSPRSFHMGVNLGFKQRYA